MVNLGPGSFTGIRVGLAAARALGLAWAVPVGGYGCLDLRRDLLEIIRRTEIQLHRHQKVIGVQTEIAEFAAEVGGGDQVVGLQRRPAGEAREGAADRSVLAGVGGDRDKQADPEAPGRDDADRPAHLRTTHTPHAPDIAVPTRSALIAR